MPSLRRTGAISAPLSFVMSVPSIWIEPASGSISPAISALRIVVSAAPGRTRRRGPVTGVNGTAA